MSLNSANNGSDSNPSPRRRAKQVWQPKSLNLVKEESQYFRQMIKNLMGPFHLGDRRACHLMLDQAFDEEHFQMTDILDKSVLDFLPSNPQADQAKYILKIYDINNLRHLCRMPLAGLQRACGDNRTVYKWLMRLRDRYQVYLRDEV